MSYRTQCQGLGGHVFGRPRQPACGRAWILSDFASKRERAAVAAGPAIGVAPKPMNAGKGIRGDSEIAVPDVIEFDRPDLRPQPLQALRDSNLESLGLVARANHRSAGDKAI